MELNKNLAIMVLAACLGIILFLSGMLVTPKWLGGLLMLVGFLMTMVTVCLNEEEG